jgi:nitrile hydratase
MAMRELLIESGRVGREELDAFGESVAALSPVNGARLVARAWLDADFRARLLADAQSAAAEMGIVLPDDPKIVVLENREDTHHLVVCTLCSCYPRALLGRPPDWYKSLEYRSRAVSEPRAVLAEFGLRFTDDVAVRVVDSTADCRYLVLPIRPGGTEGMSEEELVGLVTRDSMIGAGQIAVQG